MHYMGKILNSHVSNKVRKAAKIRNRYNQIPHLTQDTTWESDNKSEEDSPFEAGDHKVEMNRHVSIKTQEINNTN